MRESVAVTLLHSYMLTHPEAEHKIISLETTVEVQINSLTSPHLSPHPRDRQANISSHTHTSQSVSQSVYHESITTPQLTLGESSLVALLTHHSPSLSNVQAICMSTNVQQ